MSDTNRQYDRRNGNSLTAKKSLKPYLYCLLSIPSYSRPYLTGSKRVVNSTDGNNLLNRYKPVKLLSVYHLLLSVRCLKDENLVIKWYYHLIMVAKVR